MEKCLKYAGDLIAGASYFCCMKEKGHEGTCEKGGTCLAHGEYVGQQCPHWPNCILDIIRLDTKLYPQKKEKEWVYISSNGLEGNQEAFAIFLSPGIFCGRTLNIGDATLKVNAISEALEIYHQTQLHKVQDYLGRTHETLVHMAKVAYEKVDYLRRELDKLKQNCSNREKYIFEQRTRIDKLQKKICKLKRKNYELTGKLSASKKQVSALTPCRDCDKVHGPEGICTARTARDEPFLWM